MKKCARCSPKAAIGFALCAECFAAWPKGKTLDEYLQKPYNPEPKRYPDHLALVLRQRPEPATWEAGDDTPLTPEDMNAEQE